MAQEIIEETGKNVATFMGDFTTQYIATIIQSKLDDKISQAVQNVFPAEIADKLLGGGDEGNDEEKEEEKEDKPSIASGVAVVGYRTAEGPDKVDHRYYDFSCWNIKTKDSVITKVTKKHRDLLDFSIQITKDIPDAPKIQFPGKKRFGKKDDDYYRQRFDLIRTYFKAMNEDQKVSTSDLFLKFFHLKADPDREVLLGLFMNTLQSICEKESIDWNSAVDRARRLGIDLDEAEMLKVIAIVKVGGPATEKLQQVVRENTPAFLPGNVTNRFVSKADLKLASAIATSVENGWKAAGDSFNQIVSTLNDTLEKASAPLMDVFTKAAQPIGDVVKKAFAKGQSKMEVNDGLDRKITSKRFPLLKEFFENVESGAFEARLKLYKSLDKLDEVYKYINFVRYNLGNPEWAEWVPFLNDLQDNHYRLTIALIDIAHILARGGIAAFAPLLKYVDEAAQNFDEKTHQEKLQNAVRTGGKHLARQYFALEDDIRRCLWTCGYSSTEKVTQLARQTIYKEADLLGQVAHKWKPTSNGDARKTFVTILEKRLDKFLSWAVQSWVSTIRDSTQDQIADLFERMSGDAIKELCSTLDEAFSALPDPLNKYLKPGKIISSLLHKMVVNASVIVVKEMAKSTEKRLYDVNCIEVDAADENEVWRLRWSPYIRKEEELGDAEEEPIVEKPEKKAEENVDSNQEEQDGNKEEGDEEEEQPGTEG